MNQKNLKKTAGGIVLVAAASASILSVTPSCLARAAEASSVVKDTIITNTPAQGTLTIKKTDTASPPKAVEGAVYTAYKIMSLNPGSTPGEYVSYEVMPPYQKLLAERGITADHLGNYPASKLETLIQELEEIARGEQGIASQPTDKDQGITSLTLPVGWYLIVETTTPEGTIAVSPFLAAMPSTNNLTIPGEPQKPGTEWTYHIEAAPKAPRITVDKKIVNGQGEHDSAFVSGKTYYEGKNDTAGRSDYVKYGITTAVPAYGPSYFHNGSRPVFAIHDTMSSGLTIQNSVEYPIEIKVGAQTVPETEGSKANYTITAAPKDTQEADLQISFTEHFLKNEAYRGKDITVTYYAQLNDQAVMGREGNTNNVVLSIWDKPGHTTTFSPEKDTPDKVNPDTYVYTYGIEVEKFAQENGAALSGAEFQLFRDKELKNPVTGADGKEIQITDEAGKISFPRLDTGAYYLKEVKSPSGYSLLSGPVKVELLASKDELGKVINGEFTLKVNGKNITEASGTKITRLDTVGGIATVAIENHKGFSLPQTGGTGILVILGISVTGLLSMAFYMMRTNKKER